MNRNVIIYVNRNVNVIMYNVNVNRNVIIYVDRNVIMYRNVNRN